MSHCVTGSPKPGISTEILENENKSQELEIKNNTKESPETKDKDDTKKIRFKCENCQMEEWCDYFGKEPPFVNRIKFLEDCYTMRDIFSPPPPPSSKGSRSKAEYFFVLGAHCIECNKVVCKDLGCSVFYGKTYCLNCAEIKVKKFPLEIQTKIKKQIVTLYNNISN